MYNLSGTKRAVLLLILLVFPCAVYILLRTGVNKYKQLPYFGPRELAANSTDTIYHSISNFSLVNQNGDSITHTVVDSSIYVADFFFTTCPSICPTMTKQMARVNERFAELPDLKLISFTVNPEGDSVPVLATYAKEHKATTPKWTFATGDKKEIYRIARNDYMVNALQGDGGPDDFIHSELLVLVDKEKHIRGYYDGTNTKAVDTLIDAIKALRMQYRKK